MQRLRRPLTIVVMATAVILSTFLLARFAPGLLGHYQRQPAPDSNIQPANPPAAPIPPHPAELQNLIDTYDTPVQIAAYRTNLAWRLPGEAENLAVAARLLNGTVLQPGETFSQNSRLGPYTKKRGYVLGPMYVGTKIIKAEGGGVCQMSTTLFNAAVLADLEIISRRSHSMTVPYVPAGQDATVATGKSDFVFRNNTADPILIWSEVIGNYEWLSVEFYSRHKAPQVVWNHQETQRTPFKTTFIPDWQLPKGSEKEQIPGADGVTVKSWVVVTYRDGSTRVRSFGTHTYNPCTQVVRRGMK